MKTENKVFDRSGKMSIYTVAMTVILLAVLIVVNLLVASLPVTVTVIDTSSTSMYTLSETTEKFIKKLDSPVTIYYLCSGGEENPTLRNFLDRYPALSEQITIKVVDPIADPAFTGKYTDGELSNYSVILESEKRFKVVDFNEFVYYYNEAIGRMTPEELSYYSYYAAQYLQYYETKEFFDGDNVITCAVEYVLADSVPTLYRLEGHGESNLSDVIYQNYLDYTGVTCSSLNIALDGQVPEDCTCLVINAPTSDLTSEEADKISAYIDGGGNVLMLSTPAVAGFANLNALTAKLGLSAADGTVYEGDSSKHYARMPQYIFPTVQSHNATDDYLSAGYSALVPNAHGINISAVDGVTVTTLMSTGESAYAVTADGNSAPRSFALGVCAEKGSARFVWISSGEFISDNFIYGTNGANFYLFCGILNWMQGSFTSQLPTIDAVDMTSPTLTLSEAQANTWANVLIIIVPVAVIAVGFVVWIRRRRR